MCGGETTFSTESLNMYGIVFGNVLVNNFDGALNARPLAQQGRLLEEIGA